MKKAFWLTMLLAVTIGVLPVYAQEGEIPGEEAELQAEEDEEGWGSVALRWVNFIILFGGLGYLLRQPATEFFQTRLGTIQGGLERARGAHADADEKMAVIEGRLSRLSTEIGQIRSDAEESARVERDRIVADAKGEVARALKQSQAEVDRVARGMEHEVRAEIADSVIARAEEQLRSRLSDEDRKRLVKRAAEQL